MKIGVLALQGDFAEHITMLKRLKVDTAEVRLPEQLKGLDGLIIPGGESTTIGKLAVAYNLMEPLKQFLDVPAIKQATGTKEDYHAVFIRAPIIESVEGDAKVLASVADGRIVAAQQGHLLATSFHPELTNDTRFHEYFLSLAD